MAADTIVTRSKLTAIANAIRSKTGGSSQMTLDEMPTAIASIPSGSADDRLWRQMLGLIGVTSNPNDAWCEYEIGAGDQAALYAAIANGLPSGNTGLNTRGLRPFAFAYSQGLKRIRIPDGLQLSPYAFSKSHVEEIDFAGSWGYASWQSSNDGFTMTGNSPSYGTSPFMDAIKLQSLDLSGMGNVSNFQYMDYLVAGCAALERITLPSSITRLTGSAFKNCASLVSLTVPAAVTNMYQNASGCMAGCTALEEVDILGSPKILGGTYSAWFGTSEYGSSNATFRRLIIRGSTMAEICSSSGASITNGYLFGGDYVSGDYAARWPANLTVYVPDALVATYKADANWGRYASIITGLSDLA